jgi:hypothetical protein
VLAVCATRRHSPTTDNQAEIDHLQGSLITADTFLRYSLCSTRVASKCIKLRTNKVRDGTSRGKFLRPVPCTHLVNEGVF